MEVYGISVSNNAAYVRLYNKWGKLFIFLIDTGAHISVLKEEALGIIKVNEGDKVKIKGISGNQFDTIGSVKLKLSANRRFNFCQTLQVIPKSCSSFNSDGILGADFLTAHNVDIKFSNWTMIVNEPKRATIALLQYDQILYKSLPPYSRCHIQMLTNHNTSVYVEEACLNDNVFLHGCVQNPVNNTLTLTVDNLSHTPTPLKEFIPTIFTLNDCNVYTRKEKNIHNEEKCSNDKFLTELEPQLNLNGLSPQIAAIVKKVCKQFASIFHSDNEIDLPAKDFVQKIFLKPDAVPKYVKQYPLPPTNRRVIAEKVREMVQQGIAEPSVSSWNAPVLVVPKKDGKCLKDGRLVIDYRRLNDVVEDDKFPIPDITEILDGMDQEKFFTTLDLNQGYYQIQLDKDSRPYTAFTTSDGHFQLTRMPMGLKTSPSCFSRIMSIALRDLIGKICYVYLDDIIIYGKTVEQHEKNLATVFERLQQVGLKVKLKKCAFFRNSVTYLGHIISEKGLSPDPAKYQAITDFPAPETVVQVQSFLGLVNYYRRFVKDFSTIARPLYDLTKKNHPFNWTTDCQTAFDSLKQRVTSPPVLAFPDFSKPFILQTDSSEFALGAVLMNHDRRPIAFLSRSLKKEERNYHITDKELLAIVWSIKEFENYLFGQKFIVETDHRALVYLFKMNNPSSRLTRFRLTLEQFDFSVEYIKGEQNKVADALSRITINDLKELSCNVLTRAAKQREEVEKVEKEKNEIKDTDNEEQIVTKLLRKINDVPLIKFCNNIDEITQEKKHALIDKNKLVCCIPDEGIIYVTLPRPLDEPIEHALHSVKLGLSLVSKKAKIDRFAIKRKDFEDLGHNRTEILKFLGKNKEKSIKFYVIPDVEHIESEDVQEKILKNLHEMPTGGHFGPEKMWKTLKLKYYWPHMKKQIENLVRSCPICQTKKHTNIKKIPMKVTDTPATRFDRVFMDIVGPLPTSHSNNKYILTVQDDLTKFMVAEALPDKSANTVARTLVESFFFKYHFPKFLISDSGSEFANKTQQAVCGILKIQEIRSAPYHHQTIGSLENSHKVLGNFLRSFSEEDKYNWDLWLPYFSYAYNSTVHFATGYTPFELMFGEDNTIPDGKLKEIEPCYDIEDYSKELKYRLNIALDDAKRHINIEKEKRKIAYDKKNKTKLKNVNVGDYVLVKSEVGDKLDSIWKGPYLVVEIDDCNCLIKIRNNIKKIHKDNMKLFNT